MGAHGWRDLGTVQDIAAGVRAGRLDPVALTERALDRAGEVASLGAVVHLDAERALRDARAVATDPAGRLAGVPLLVKEIIAVAGMPYRCGSRVFADRVAEVDAEVVRRARAAGAVIIGLSHSHEFAYGCTGTSNRSGPCRNPHDPTRMTAGSSSGSAAAVAAGVVPVAIGSDTAGSVRMPAALCGVVGAKPGRDLLPTAGLFPLSTSLDHVGVLAGSVSDARYLISVLAGAEPADHPPAGPPRLGVLTNPEPAVCAAEVAQAYRATVRRLVAAGASLVEVRLPEWSELTATGFDIQGPEAAAVHADLIESRAHDYQPDVRERLRAAAEVPGWRYVRALARAVELAGAADRVLRSVDAVILPTVPIVAPPLDAEEAEIETGREPIRDLLLRNNRPMNVLGAPALSVPIPSPGLPIGLQVLAAEDASAFSVAEFVERVSRTEP